MFGLYAVIIAGFKIKICQWDNETKMYKEIAEASDFEAASQMVKIANWGEEHS